MAVYYCGALEGSQVLFGNGTLLLLKGIESRGRIIQSPISESVQSYYCAVVTCGEISNGNGTKEDSTGIESRGRIIQSPISESVQSYYCAVVTCGEISNGNGTKEDSTDEIPAQRIVQPRLSVTAQLGESVTLECSVLRTQHKHSTLTWFKQVIGQPPRYILTDDGQADATFYVNFKDKSRFKRQRNEKSFNLMILKTESLDMAVYYCAALEGSQVLFGNGTLLLLKGKLKG
ncbi:UNVERIFIED_CONTAM: hypothetical protein FKN15_059044 [Acipenser sinensis]